LNQEKRKPFSKFNQTRVLAVFFLIFVPLNNLNVAYYDMLVTKTSEYIDIMMPILLIYGVFSPFVLLVIKKVMMIAYRKGKMKFKSPDHAWRKLSIMQSAVVAATFIYGFIVFTMSGDIQRMLYFYPIGAVWAFFFWPTRKRYENFISQFDQQ